MLAETIISLVTQCSSGVDHLVLKSLIKQESANNPFAIHDGYTHKAHFPESKIQAVKLAKKLMAKKHRLDIGLTQINTQNFNWLNLTVESAFNPCTSIKASSTVLKDAMRRTPDLRKQLSIYNSGRKNSTQGLRYADSIIRRMGRVPKTRLSKNTLGKTKQLVQLGHVKPSMGRSGETTALAINDGFTQFKAQPMQSASDGFSN